MSRTLGSFNRHVNLPKHPQDEQPVRPPRMAALRPESLPRELRGVTDAAKFVSGRGERGRRGPENRRYAGAIMNIDLRETNVMPYENTGTIDYGANGIEQLYSVRSGEVYQKANADISKEVVESTQTGRGVKISHGLQQEFAPPLAGAAESRTAAVSAPLPDYYTYFYAPK
jgi:hypothetical protein